MLHLLAAGVGPSRFISCALHRAEVMLLQDTSCAAAAESSCAWGAVPWGSVQGLLLHDAAHVQPGPTVCEPSACSVPVCGWVGEAAFGLCPWLLYLWKLGNCSWKKASRGCLAKHPSAGSALQSTCVCSGVQRRLWKPASACPESV